MNDWSRYRLTIAWVAPLAAFFLVASLFGNLLPYRGSHSGPQLDIDGTRYLSFIVVRVIAIGLVVAFFLKTYLKTFPFRIDRWGVIAGVVGAAIWIGLCSLQIESAVVSGLGLSDDLLGTRDSVNPFAVYSDSLAFYTFLAFRFTLLVIAVPIAEELFLRGFLMRAMDSENWHDLPLANIGTYGLVIGTVYGIAAHPSEAIAAAFWFSLITWLMVKTGRFWNCVLAHAITNLILGIYVCQSGNWHLW
ncbi:MAG: CPBP family glutamic-type intramembrane protease [Pirellulaceae bacterium]